MEAVPGSVPPETSAARTAAIKKHWAVQAAVVLIPVLVSSVFVSWTASKQSKEDTQFVKDKAEQGYQDVDKVWDEQRAFNRGVAEQLQQVKADLAELAEARRRPPRPTPRRAPRAAGAPALTPPPPLPKAELAPSLDQALERAQKAVPPPAPTPPAQPPPPPATGQQPAPP